MFDLDGPAVNRLRWLLREWRAAVPSKDRTADLVGELYELLGELAVRSWDLTDPFGGQPYRHPGPFLRPPGRLRIGAPWCPCRPALCQIRR